MLGSDSDSDSDSVEELQIKRFLNKDFGQGIKQAKALQSCHGGIKKQPGFYQLPDRKERSLEGKVYGGKHWDVDVGNMDRSTRRLTIHKIDTEVAKEQERRTKLEQTERVMAVKTMEPLNRDFSETVKFSEKKMKAEDTAVRNYQAKIKDDVQLQLLHVTHAELAAIESEAERLYQIKLLKAMLSDVHKTSSVEDLVDAMSATNQKRNYINRDLEEAFGRLIEDENELNDDYKVAMMEMLDESLIKVVLNFDRDITRHLSEEEQKERVKEQNNLLKDEMKKRAIKNFENVLDDMRRIYRKVLEEEERIEERYKEKVREIKVRVQEELTRKMAAKWVEKACADEKTRRIQEFEKGEKRDNKAWDAMKHLMTRVQRQMILSKFDGKWVDFKQEAKKEVTTKNELLPETEQDRKIREMRTRSRRPSCVVRGDVE